jgi:hypothetical protein
MDSYASRGYMKATSGTWVNLIEPDPNTILLGDIVTSAKRVVRFAGHSKVTLAEHSCRVHDIARYHFKERDGRVLRAALMHDAHEAYVVDIPSPLKTALREVLGGPSTYDEVEARVAAVLAEKFDFDYPHPPVVKEADTIALAIEANLTWGAGTAEEWGLPTPPDGFDFFLDDICSRLERTY